MNAESFFVRELLILPLFYDSSQNLELLDYVPFYVTIQEQTIKKTFTVYDKRNILLNFHLENS